MKRPHIADDLTNNDHPRAVDWNTLAEKLNRPKNYINEDGFEVQLWSGTIHPSKDWVAWVDYYEKRPSDVGFVDCNYYLCINVDGKQVFEWNVETYNPFFGATTCYMNWHDDYLIYVYLEKHRLYGVTLTLEKLVTRIKLGAIGSEFRVDNNVVSLMRIEDYNGFIKRFRLPSWEKLPDITEDEATKKGIIESG